LIKITDLKKSYKDNIIFDGINIEFEEGSINCILGPSGIGKSTLFNIISGLEKYDSGRIEGLSGKRIGYLFQEDRLLEWRTVYENIIFVINDEKNAKQRTEESIKNVRLTGYENYYPAQLSGGMRRRVALARAIAYEPDVLIFDEPFKGLDIALKEDIIENFYELYKIKKFSLIMATHDIDEAIYLSDIILILSGKPAIVKAEIRTNNTDKAMLESIIREHLEEAQ